MSTLHDAAAQLATDAAFVSLVRSFLKACQAFSTPEHVLQRSLFNVFDGTSIVAYDYLVGLCALLQAGLMGLAGLRRIQAAMGDIRLTQQWDDINDTRMSTKKTPESVVLRGFINETRFCAVKSVLVGSAEVAFFVVFLMQGLYILHIYQPSSVAALMESSAWAVGLIAFNLTLRIVNFIVVHNKRTEAHEVAARMAASKRVSAESVVEIAENAGFIFGPHESIMALCPNYDVTIYPHRQVGLELSFIRAEIDALCASSPNELQARLSAADQLNETILSLDAFSATLNFVAFLVTAAVPVNYFHPNFLGNFFRDVPHTIFWSEFLRDAIFTFDPAFSYFVYGPSIDSVRNEGKKQLKKD